MGSKILAIFLFVVGLGVALYLYNSGTLAKLGSLFPNASSSLFSIFSRPSSSLLGYGGPNDQPAPAYPGNIPAIQNQTQTSIPGYQIPQGFTAAQLSPYFHEVRFGNLSAQQITLYAYVQGAATVDVTGWSIKTNRGGTYIPQAVNLYDPSGLTAASDIRLDSSDYLNLYANSSPTNMRVNKCSGYLNQVNQFNPPFPSQCPYANRSEISSFSGQCQNYILSIGVCGMPNMASPSIPRNDYSCDTYLQNHFSYKSCFDDHLKDQDFLSNEWRVWMGSSPLDPYHDNVELLDNNGLLVDVYAY